MAEQSLSTSASTSAEASRLWQWPLLIVAIGLFAYASYLFVDPGKRADVPRFLEISQSYIDHDRPEAAVAVLNQLQRVGDLSDVERGRVHLLTAQAIDRWQSLQRIDIEANHRQIVRHSQLAADAGVDLRADGHERLARTFRSLDQIDLAATHYRTAMRLDADSRLSLQRRLISMFLETGRSEDAEQELVAFASQPGLDDTERAWSSATRGRMLGDAGRFAEAQVLLSEAERLGRDGPDDLRGEVAFRLAYAAWRLGNYTDAEQYAKDARQLLTISHPLEADATLLLARMMLGRNDVGPARDAFETIILTHPSTQAAVISRLNRGLIRLASLDETPAMQDFEDVVNAMSRPSMRGLRDEIVAGLASAEQTLVNRGQWKLAIEVLGHEQTLLGEPPAAFFGRLAVAFENHAVELSTSAKSLEGEEQARRLDESRRYLARSGRAWVTYSERLTTLDDAGSAAMLWKGINAFERAGETQAVIDSLQEFVAQRPDDPDAPRAVLQLGRTFQSIGQMDRAIDAFLLNQFRYPRALDATRSLVPLAQAYIAKGPDTFAKAEETLMSVVENNRAITPDSSEFREAVFELAKLYYRTQRFDLAVVRLEEFRSRYPDDPRQAQLRFLMGDSYRRSADAIAAKLAEEPADGQPVLRPSERLELSNARRDRLRRAEALFEQVVESRRDNTDPAALLFIKLSHFYLGDVRFDQGDFEAAVRAYDTAAFRYQDDPSSLAAYVQIVNAYVALGRPEDARAANERARWMLRKIGPESFDASSYVIPRQSWEQWLTYADQSGLW
jgi:tetratricopeptide (TPR) repeat protein